MSFVEEWVTIAKTLFAQALAGEPELAESATNQIWDEMIGFQARIAGDMEGTFSVAFDAALLDVPLLGEGTDQKAGWAELLREVIDAAAGEMLAKMGVRCRVEQFESSEEAVQATRSLVLKTKGASWNLLVADGLRSQKQEVPSARDEAAQMSRNVELLLDVELEATLRFGRRELRLGEILEMGPGDVVELDRQVTDPVDLIVGDKIVARGEVVLVKGNFGLRVTEVTAPQKRLETVRCLF